MNETRALGAKPILITPMVMNAWSAGAMRNVFTESGAEYAPSMKEVATALSVPLIDLNAKSYDYFSVLDADTCSRFFYNTYPAGEYPNYPDGLSDGTHFQQMGALLMAKFIAEGIREWADDPVVSNLAAGLNEQYPVAIKSNVNGVGRVTFSTELPAGINLTLKALPDSGHYFLAWRDGDNNDVASSSLHELALPAAASSYIAYFDSLAAVGPPPPRSGVSAGRYAGGTWRVGELMDFSSLAYDFDGAIARVEYFGGNAGGKLGESATPPFNFGWTVETGAYTVWAEAIDDDGLRGRSLDYSVQVNYVNQAPSVSFTHPTAGSLLDAGTDPHRNRRRDRYGWCGRPRPDLPRWNITR